VHRALAAPSLYQESPRVEQVVLALWIDRHVQDTSDRNIGEPLVDYVVTNLNREVDQLDTIDKQVSPHAMFRNTIVSERNR
jgi:hypothetical protein